eukprot:CAMPEP_0171002756 /NCGR_PEP_ID=MMETSP0736-20130129/16417_1 /TAXON_ID=186038 /ORGANISM="Fragilariopsis kerguelensis, Strain L26-C5" /LENGTH=303 /DNA_ID=CAMNT_0011431243 /DNA_START=205 /DNA_END=1116 /DNA_ORIENTATION=+
MKFLINKATFLFVSGLISVASSAIQQNSLRGSSKSVRLSKGTGCSCDKKTNVLSCDDESSSSSLLSSGDDKEENCFCNEDGNLICETPAEPSKDPLLPARIGTTVSAPTNSSPSTDEVEVAKQPIVLPIPPTPTLYSIDGCICDGKTNVLSCDDPDDEDQCFCNLDGNLICKELLKLPSTMMGIAVFKSAPIDNKEQDESSNHCHCDDKMNVLLCDDDDSDAEEKCFCNIDGTLICEKEPIDNKGATRIFSVPDIVLSEEEATVSSLPHDCSCDTKTNVLLCDDDSEEEDTCFCNEDGNLRCR